MPALPCEADGPGFAVYVHWPFCMAKCPYCDFNSHVRHREIDQPRFAAALVRELEHYAARTGGRTVRSIFFGGGTPSLMLPETVAAAIDAVGRLWAVEDGAEITLEANPTSVEADRFAGYRAAGVNRLSLGVQALRDDALKRLGRLHDRAEAVAAIELARKTFPRLSFDLIYARPDQHVADWQTELDEAIALAADHLSLYQLTIEPGTPFYDLERAGRLWLPADHDAGEFYELTQEVCAAAGLPAYEISNHARDGAQSRHNLVYWRYGEYVGVGAGAHGRFVEDGNRYATSAIRHPESWLAAVEQHGHGRDGEEIVSRNDEAMEYLLMGLRLAEGIDAKRYEVFAGQPLDAARLDQLHQLGLVLTNNDRVAATARGRAVLNQVIATLAG